TAFDRQCGIHRPDPPRGRLSRAAADDSAHQARPAFLQSRCIRVDLTSSGRRAREKGTHMYKQLQQRGAESPPVNVGTLRDMKVARDPIACLTAYDASFAQLVDLAGTDVVLVGDSLGMV